MQEEISHFITDNQHDPILKDPNVSFRFVSIQSKGVLRLGFHGCNAPYKKGELKRHYKDVKREWQRLNPKNLVLDEEEEEKERDDFLVYSWKKTRVFY